MHPELTRGQTPAEAAGRGRSKDEARVRGVLDALTCEEKVWAAIAARIAQFETIKLVNAWAGHYAFNTFDQNSILGSHTGDENFVSVNGFPGRGFQQSPAMGRGTAELITYGDYRSLDRSPFGCTRATENRPFVEKAVI